MKIFGKKRSSDAALIQELRLELCSLQEQMRSERQDKASLVRTLDEELLRSQHLQGMLDVTSVTLTASRAEVQALNAQNQGLHEENARLRASVSERDGKIHLLQQEIDKKDISNMVIDDLKTNYGQLKVANARLHEKIIDLEDQVGQKTLLLQRQDKELSENRLQLEQFKLLETSHAALKQDAHQMEGKIQTLLEEQLSMKAANKAATEEAKETISALRKDIKVLDKGLDSKQRANQTLQLNLDKKMVFCKKLQDQIHQTTEKLMEEQQKNLTLHDEVTKHYDSLQESLSDRLSAQEQSHRMFQRFQEEKQTLKAACDKTTTDLQELQSNLEDKAKIISDFEEKNKLLESEKHLLTEELKSLKSQTSVTTLRLETQLQEAKAEQEKLKQLQEQLKPKAETEQILQRLQEEKLELKTDRDNAMEEADKLRKEVSVLRGKVEELFENLNYSANVVANMKMDIAALQKERMGLLNRLIECKNAQKARAEQETDKIQPQPEFSKQDVRSKNYVLKNQRAMPNFQGQRNKYQ